MVVSEEPEYRTFSGDPAGNSTKSRVAPLNPLHPHQLRTFISPGKLKNLQRSVMNSDHDKRLHEGRKVISAFADTLNLPTEVTIVARRIWDEFSAKSRRIYAKRAVYVAALVLASVQTGHRTCSLATAISVVGDVESQAVLRQMKKIKGCVKFSYRRSNRLLKSRTPVSPVEKTKASRNGRRRRTSMLRPRRPSPTRNQTPAISSSPMARTIIIPSSPLMPSERVNQSPGTKRRSARMSGLSRPPTPGPVLAEHPTAPVRLHSIHSPGTERRSARMFGLSPLTPGPVVEHPTATVLQSSGVPSLSGVNGPVNPNIGQVALGDETIELDLPDLALDDSDLSGYSALLEYERTINYTDFMDADVVFTVGPDAQVPVKRSEGTSPPPPERSSTVHRNRASALSDPASQLAPLPAEITSRNDWVTCTDVQSGRRYYYNTATSETTWIAPPSNPSRTLLLAWKDPHEMLADISNALILDPRLHYYDSGVDSDMRPYSLQRVNSYQAPVTRSMAAPITRSKPAEKIFWNGPRCHSTAGVPGRHHAPDLNVIQPSSVPIHHRDKYLAMVCDTLGATAQFERACSDLMRKYLQSDLPKKRKPRALSAAVVWFMLNKYHDHFGLRQRRQKDVGKMVIPNVSAAMISKTQEVLATLDR